MTVMEKIIELLSKTKAGLTYKEIEQKLRDEYGREFGGKDIYVYLGRLKKKGIIKNTILDRNKLYTLISENLRKDISKEFVKLVDITKRLIMGEKISNEEERWLIETCQL
jgi:predicted transcriptional regulator